MYCEKCSHRIVMPAFATGTCKICGRKVISANTPPDALCPTCSLTAGTCAHCGITLHMPTVLLSLHEKWWDLMLCGDKTLEIRKSAPKTSLPFRVVVYLTAPASQIVGEFVCPAVEVGMDANGGSHGVYFQTGAHCVPLRDLHEYAGGKALYGWKIENVQPLPQLITLSDLGLSRPPQSWQYLFPRK